MGTETPRVRLGGGNLVGVEGCGRDGRREDGGEGGREEGGKDGEVPVFGDVPVKGVEGVQEDEEEPMFALISICLFSLSPPSSPRFHSVGERETYHSRKIPVSLKPILLGS